jgi:D-aspartate ligase
MKTAIVLSSHTMGLGVIRSLGMAGVPIVVFYYEKKDMGYVSKFVKEKIFTPHPEKYEDKFIRILMQYGKKYDGSILIPADDATLISVSKNKSVLSDHYIVACPNWEISEKFIDKKYTYAIAESINLPAPKSFLPRSLEDLEKYGKIVGYPCIVKPCRSHTYFEHFRKKMVKVKNIDELVGEYLNVKASGIEVLIQEYIPGDDTQGVNYNSYFWAGEALIEFTAQKIRLSPPEFGVPRVVKSKYLPELIESGRKIIRAIGFSGFSCTEFKKDSRDGIYKLMEINGRHNRSGLLSLRCGINFPLIEYKHLTEGKRPVPCSFQPDKYWIDEFHDIVSSLKYYRKERYSLKEYLRPYFRSNIFSVFNFSDPKPFLKRLMDPFKKKGTHFLKLGQFLTSRYNEKRCN